MGFGTSSLFLKINFILLIIALLVQILGTALPYWFTASVSSSYKIHGGLWKYCVETSVINTCTNFSSNLTDWFKAVRAFEIIGVLTVAAALILTIVVVFVKDMKVLKLVAWILSFVSFAFILIGVCIYAGEATGYYDNYSGAFVITIIASIICLVTGVLGLLDWMGKGK